MTCPYTAEGAATDAMYVVVEEEEAEEDEAEGEEEADDLWRRAGGDAYWVKMGDDERS